MRDLILSDIHANWEALEAVLKRAAGQYDRIVCCGDLIGYGPDPNRVLDWVRANVAFVIRGNHDKAAVGLENLEWFNAVAKAAALWTLKELTPVNLEYTRALAKGPLLVDGYQIAHGSPLDEDEYVVGPAEGGARSHYLDEKLTFGHTHGQRAVRPLRGRQVRMLTGPAWNQSPEELDLSLDEGYLINPGSIGQPRDGDPRAAYILYDPADRRLYYHREPYDIEGVQAKIRKAGLPDMLAERLAVGQ